MPKIAKLLTEKEIQRITDNGFHAVGGVSGLFLRVAEKTVTGFLDTRSMESEKTSNSQNIH